MKKLFGEFKTFISKGNVMDMAVGVIIGGAFGKIVTSLVNDILMPLLGLATGGVNFNEKMVVLSPEIVNEAGEVVKAAATLKYGSFIQNILDFLIIALCIFFITKAMNTMTKKLKKEEEAKPEAPKGPTQEELLTEIRDLLKNK